MIRELALIEDLKEVEKETEGIDNQATIRRAIRYIEHLEDRVEGLEKEKEGLET